MLNEPEAEGDVGRFIKPKTVADAPGQSSAGWATKLPTLPTVAAQANNIWFPHVVHSSVVTTLLNVIDTDGNSSGSQHIAYVHKTQMAGETTAEFNFKTCTETNGNFPLSARDVQSFDVGGVIAKPGDQGVLFNDPGIKNKWRGDPAADWVLDGTIPAGAVCTRGYVTVEDAGGALEGFAMVFDYTTGSAWGYAAEEVTTTHPAAPFAAHLMPPKEVITRLLVTPYLAGSMIAPHADLGKVGTAVTLDKIDATGDVADRDENVWSGAAPAEVVCVGTVDAYGLLSEPTQARVPDGGWMKILTAATTLPAPVVDSGTGSAVVYQLDFGGQRKVRRKTGCIWPNPALRAKRKILTPCCGHGWHGRSCPELR